jgi:MFS transporter, DHA2 family, methylenomycin A resistance protein
MRRSKTDHHLADSHLKAAQSLTLGAMSLGYGVVQLDVTIVNTALNSIGSGLGGGSVTALQWVVSTYTIAFAALILTAGALGDRIGAKRVFIAGFVIFTLASVGCALAPSIGWLIGARALQGVGAAVLVPNSLALLNHAYPDARERARAVSIWAAGASVALTAGPLAGGVLVSVSSWRSIFLVNLPIGLLALWLSVRYAPETPRSSQRRLDLPGQILAVSALALLAAAIIEAGRLGWGSPWVLGGLGVAGVLIAAFVAQEARTAHPMLPLRLFRQRMFSLMSAGGLVVNIAFYGLIFVLSLYFQQINHLSPLATGLAFLPLMGAVLPCNLFAPQVSERLGAPWTIAIGATLTAAGCLALLMLDRGTSYGRLCGQLVVMGSGLGLLVPPLTSELLGSVDKSRSGLAAAVLNSARQSGSVIGVSLFGSLLGGSGGFLAGARTALMIAAALLLISATAVVSLGRTAAVHAVPPRSARDP